MRPAGRHHGRLPGSRFRKIEVGRSPEAPRSSTTASSPWTRSSAMHSQRGGTPRPSGTVRGISHGNSGSAGTGRDPRIGWCKIERRPARSRSSIQWHRSGQFSRSTMGCRPRLNRLCWRTLPSTRRLSNRRKVMRPALRQPGDSHRQHRHRPNEPRAGRRRPQGLQHRRQGRSLSGPRQRRTRSRLNAAPAFRAAASFPTPPRHGLRPENGVHCGRESCRRPSRRS